MTHERNKFLTEIIIGAVEGGCMQFEFQKYRFEDVPDTFDSINGSVMAIDCEGEHPETWKTITIHEIESALKKFLKPNAEEKLGLHSRYIGEINEASRQNDSGLLDAELFDYIFQVALNGEVIFG